jgi:dihydrofolate synthase / folylpolyglutamate synthase
MSVGSFDDVLEAYARASSYIEGLIQGPPSPPADATSEEIRARAIARNERLAAFLEFLGNPHRDYRTVHIAGTSGKGSTSAFLTSILSSAGLRVGMHVSPYLQVETEKLQINDRLIAPGAFAGHVEALENQVQRWVKSGNARPTYGEFWVALTFFTFSREQCDIVVCEAGAGGRFDLTNVIQPEISLITSVGLDHVRTLGGTIPEIAWHKAGIIKPGVPAITTVSHQEALPVIRDEAEKQSSSLIELLPERDFKWSSQSVSGESLQMEWLSRPVHLPLAGPFQASNAALAACAVRLLQADGVSDIAMLSAIEEGIEKTRFPGRVEIVQSSPHVVLDGAHNPEKVGGLVSALDLMPAPKRRIMVLGSLGGHDFLKVAAIAAPIADEVIITAPSAVERTSAPVEEIVAIVEQTGKPYEVILEPIEAIQAALERAGPDDQVVVTGSLYLVGAVREHWYPSREILLQQTCFPKGKS